MLALGSGTGSTALAVQRSLSLHTAPRARWIQILIGVIITAGIREEGLVLPGRLQSIRQRIEGARRSLEPGGVSRGLATEVAADGPPWAVRPAPSMLAQPSSASPAGDFLDNFVKIIQSLFNRSINQCSCCSATCWVVMERKPCNGSDGHCRRHTGS